MTSTAERTNALKDAVWMMRNARKLLVSYRYADALELYASSVPILCNYLAADSEHVRKSKAVLVWLNAAASHQTGGVHMKG
jgi:hypothetical protein